MATTKAVDVLALLVAAHPHRESDEADNLRAIRDALSPQLGAAMKQGKHEEANALRAEIRAASERLDEIEKQGS